MKAKEETKWNETFQLAGNGRSSESEARIRPTTISLQSHIEDFSLVIRSLGNDTDEKFLRDFSTLLPGISLDMKKTLKDHLIDNDQAVSLERIFEATADGKLNIWFANGRMKYSNQGIEAVAIIPYIKISNETIDISVSGEAELVEEVLKRVLVFLFTKASLDQNWATIKKRIFSQNWRILAEVDMNIPMLQFFDSRFTSNMSDAINERIGAFGDVHYNSNGDRVIQQKKVIIDSEIKFSLFFFDEISGMLDKCTFEIDREKTYQIGTTVMRIMADCDFATFKYLINKIAAGYVSGN